MKTNFLRFAGPLSLALFAGFASSCGTHDDAMTVAQFCEQKATRECAGVATNCSVPPATCKVARVAVCVEFVQAQEPVATRPFRPDRAPACLSATEATYRQSPVTPAARRTMDDACQRVFSGMKAMAAPCESTFECDGDLICDRGVCATKRVVAADGFCANPGDVCPAGRACIATAGTSACMVPSIPAGAACDDETNPCATDLRCVEGMCAPKVQNGGQCTRDADCTDDAPYCDPYYQKTCDTGFIPQRSSPECVSFGGTP